AGRPPIFIREADGLPSGLEVIGQSEQIEFADGETEDSDESQRATIGGKCGGSIISSLLWRRGQCPLFTLLTRNQDQAKRRFGRNRVGGDDPLAVGRPGEKRAEKSDAYPGRSDLSQLPLGPAQRRGQKHPGFSVRPEAHEGNPTAVRRPCGAQVHGRVVGQAKRRLVPDRARVDVKVVLLLAIPRESYLGSIGRKARVALGALIAGHGNDSQRRRWWFGYETRDDEPARGAYPQRQRRADGCRTLYHCAGQLDQNRKPQVRRHDRGTKIQLTGESVRNLQGQDEPGAERENESVKWEVPDRNRAYQWERGFYYRRDV